MIYPSHVAIIPDWNRTWAKEKWFAKYVWHYEWFQRIIDLAKYAYVNTPIKVLSAWWLSTENFYNRENEELNYLYDLYKIVPDSLWKILEENKVNFKWIWKKDWLPDHLVDYLIEKQNYYSYNSDRYLVLAINYWGRDEIVRWVKKIISEWKWTELITEELISQYLDLWNLPEVELVIRTKWDLAKRLSWFMLWWIWYAQLYFTNVKCPEFTIDEFNKAISWFNNISWERNYGK